MKQFSANLPQKAYTAQQVRENEEQAAQACHTTLSQLMIRAGSAVTAYIQDYYQAQAIITPNVLVLCGKGNNAGDGYVIAEQLHDAGISVVVWALYDPALLRGDAHAAYARYVKKQGALVLIQPSDLDDFTIVVDAVFGAGFYGDLPDFVQSIFTQISAIDAHFVSVDIPSGVNGDDGTCSPNAFQADVTVTFIALKQGMLTGAAKGLCGMLYFAGLGVAKAFATLVNAPSSFTSEKQHFSQLPERSFDSYKQQLGHVLLIGGGKGMAGAIRLAAEACLRSGAGLVSIATHPDNVACVLQGRYELMVHGVLDGSMLKPLLDKASVIVIGPGLGLDEWASSLLEACAQRQLPLVMDADALTLYAKSQPQIQLKPSVITPHLGEAKRLLADLPESVFRNRFTIAEALHQKTGAISVLKGPGTLIQDAKRRNINRSGTSAMASAGMGDVLSGIIGALIAQGTPIFAAVSLAVYIHGLAGEEAAREGARGLLASDLFVHIRRLLG
ncbi:NAD(P)HX epimerase / NAD(P)HX dehydratase [Pseudoalteromonas luteoviolacea B = ATCC 29581]|nr:NAD(P)HX epimerase / NAD(P)HX dehydratase [Pseudoalteromonas luteoviolacea B = ATCC 29581]